MLYLPNLNQCQLPLICALTACHLLFVNTRRSLSALPATLTLAMCLCSIPELQSESCALCAGATVQVGVDPSKVVINKLKIDKDRTALLNRKKGASTDKGKFSESEVKAMELVD